MDKSESVVQERRMTGKLRTIGITMFALVELCKHYGLDLGVNREDIYCALEIVSGVVAVAGALISWGKLIYRNVTN